MTCNLCGRPLNCHVDFDRGICAVCANPRLWQLHPGESSLISITTSRVFELKAVYEDGKRVF